MAFVIIKTMSKPTYYLTLLLVLCSLPGYSKFDDVLESRTDTLWKIGTIIPICQLPLGCENQNFPVINAEEKQTAETRNNFSNLDDENQLQDQLIKKVSNKQGASKKRGRSDRLIILANRVLHGKLWCEGCGVIIEHGHIHSVKPLTLIPFRRGDTIHVYPTATLSPGFIDLLIHGADGHDVMDGTVESVHGIASKLVEEGTTAFLASSMTASEADMKKTARIISDSMQFQPPGQAKILGWHAEGPYFSAEKIGCHDPLCRRDPDIREVAKWQSASGNALKVITVAPELGNALPFIRWASGHNIVVSIGHTMASCEQTKAAIDAGATMATHLFNAMNNGSHQVAGCSAGIKTHPAGIYFTLIVDGLHIDPVNILDLAGRTDFTSRAILITDGIRARYKSDGVYNFGGQSIVVRGKEARLEGKGNLAGSMLKMNEAVANLRSYAPFVSLEDALLMASHNPARAINANRKGLVKEGYDADITLLDHLLDVQATYRNGKRAYQNPQLTNFYEFVIE